MDRKCEPITFDSSEPAVSFLEETLETKKKQLEIARLQREAFIKENDDENYELLDAIDEYMEITESLEKAIKTLKTGRY